MPGCVCRRKWPIAARIPGGHKKPVGDFGMANVANENSGVPWLRHSISAVLGLLVLAGCASTQTVFEAPTGAPPPAEWVRAIEINLLGSALMCRAVLPHFKAQHYGKIIQLSGGGATNPLPYISAYAASKAAVVRLANEHRFAVVPRGAGTGRSGGSVPIAGGWCWS